MARYLDVHPVNPQERLVAQASAIIRDQGLVAYPSDSGYALGCALDNVAGRQRIIEIRRLDDKHHFTLMCADFAQMGQYVDMSNATFRALKACTPGPYTFILKATPEVPRKLANAKKNTVGVRISSDVLVQALLRELGEPMLSSTLILPGEQTPMTDGWAVKEELDHVVDVVIDTGECGLEPTTVVDLSGPQAQVVRVGAGDPAPFE
ncbi:MAG: L-threonylcarbamoyladenylate synthase [Micrococcales bacterium]|nr:L-threonylcarbamoyladenylate synthase [Micrococcales bacterium]